MAALKQPLGGSAKNALKQPLGGSAKKMSRLAWFFSIAALSGLACAVVAEILRWLILH